MNKILKKKCKVCNKEFLVRTSKNPSNSVKSFRSKRAVTCSRKCSRDYYLFGKMKIKKIGKNNEIIKCLVCLKPFLRAKITKPYKNRLNYGAKRYGTKTCSRVCRRTYERIYMSFDNNLRLRQERENKRSLNDN